MTIGIPKALLYYKYKTLWENFFSYLEIDIITSSDTNKEILDLGVNNSIDEACLSLKIYLGHIKSLINKCDYILVPRIVSLKKREKTCTNFYALYDIVNNTYNVKILDYNIDVENNFNECYAFVEMAKELKISRYNAIKAYNYAKEKEKEELEFNIIKQETLLKSNNIKILVTGHSYNIHDNLVGKPIIKYLKDNNITVILSDICKKDFLNKEVKEISDTIYWTYNKEILSSISHYKNDVDGIILLTTFPCGPDSLTNEMIIR